MSRARLQVHVDVEDRTREPLERVAGALGRVLGHPTNSAGVAIVPGRTYRHEGAEVVVETKPWKTSEGWRCSIAPTGRGVARNVFVDELEGRK